jgi:hypothetical protein
VNWPLVALWVLLSLDLHLEQVVQQQLTVNNIEEVVDVRRCSKEKASSLMLLLHLLLGQQHWVETERKANNRHHYLNWLHSHLVNSAEQTSATKTAVAIHHGPSPLSYHSILGDLTTGVLTWPVFFYREAIDSYAGIRPLSQKMGQGIFVLSMSRSRSSTN